MFQFILIQEHIVSVLSRILYDKNVSIHSIGEIDVSMHFFRKKSFY